MAENNYDLDYTGSMVDRILDTGYDLQNQGYIFRGLASHFTGTPTERTWLIAPTGSTGFGLSSPVPPGSIGICMYNGSSWSAEVLNTLTLDSAPTTGSGNGITSGAVKTLAEYITNAIGQLEQSVSDRFTSMELEDTTGSLQAEVLSITLKYVFEGEEEALTSLSILAATATKAGLMSAADKQKLDAFVTNIRSLRIQDTTAQDDQGTEITNTLKWTIGGVTEAITAFTLYAATTSKAGLMSAADKTALDTLPSLINAGYLYSGIATPATVPSSTDAKIFYIAVDGGTYTNFGDLNVTQGINIIYKSGNAWSVAQVVGIDDEPMTGSKNVVKSGSVADNIAELVVNTGTHYRTYYQGNTTSDGQPNPNVTTRVRTGIIDNTKPIHVSIPEGLVLYAVAKYSNSSYSSWIENVSLSREDEYTCSFGCYVILIFKKSDDGNLTPADASGVEITSVDYLDKKNKINDAYVSTLKSVSGEAQANNDYFDIGLITLNNQGIPQYSARDSRVRTKQGVKFYMSAGDVVKISGVRVALMASEDGVHYTAIGWQTTDYTIETTGYYIFNCTYSTEATITTLESILDNIELVVGGVTKNLASLVRKNVDTLNGKIQGVAFDPITSVRKVDYIPNSDGNYKNNGANYKSAVIPINPYDNIAVKVNTGTSYAAFVKSYNPTDDNLVIDYCADNTRISLGGFRYMTAPADAAFFIVTIRFFGVDTIFDTLTINGVDITSSIFRNVSELNLGKGNADYYGLEKISFDIPTKKYKCQKELIMSQTVSEAGENQYQQGLAIYDGKIFSCVNYTGQLHAGYVYDLSTQELLGYIDSDIEECHYNNIQFTDVFYNDNDTYPLMFVSQCVGRGSVDYNKLFVVRLTEVNGNYQMTTVKTITPSSNMIGCYYGCTYAYNHTTNEIVAWMNTYYFGDDRTEKNKTQIYTFKCPNLLDSTDVTLDADNATRHFILPFHILQGGTCKNGMLILPIQETHVFDDVEVTLLYRQSVLEFIDLGTGVVKAFVLIARYIEPEGCCVYDNKVYVAYHDGSATDPDAECFRLESYEF